MITIGIASYGNPEKLRATIESIEKHTVQDYRLLIWHNKGKEDRECEAVIVEARKRNDRITNLVSENVGYAGAVNGLLSQGGGTFKGKRLPDTDYFLYCDNDIEIKSPGWDVELCKVLDENPEVAQVFPGAGHFGFFNGKYHECLWNAGYCWALRKSAIAEMNLRDDLDRGVDLHGPRYDAMDTSLGHHEEVDLMIRLRLAGQIIACVPSVQVLHNESSTQSPESAKRIHRGVVSWMNKWNRYFCGDVLKYPNPDPDSGEGYDPRSLRYTDWPPCALYLERWTLAQFPEWNSEQCVDLNSIRPMVQVVQTSAGEMDAIRILKPKGYYRGRAI